MYFQARVATTRDMKLILFQTLEDRDNPDEVEAQGPFVCRRKTAWLGIGYYFWDTHIQLAHWWGGAYQNGYIICKALGKMDDLCWDLHGNGLHRLEFENICIEMVKGGLTTFQELRVPHIIEFFKKKGVFNYQSIRALGMNSRHGASKLVDTALIFRMAFVENNRAYLDLKPPVQICLVQKTALSLTNYKIVYPETYSEFYV